MSQTILIEDQEDLRKLFSLNLHAFLNTDIIERQNAQHALELLDILPTVSLIICRNQTGDEETAEIILDYIEEKNLDIPLIVLGKNARLLDRAVFLESPFQWEILVSEAAKLLGVTLENLNRQVKPDFQPVSIQFFYEINSSPCDIYIRIKKSPTEYQFVKRIHANDYFDDSMINKYYNSGLRLFHVSQDYHQYFVTFVTNKLITRLEKDNLEVQERIRLNSNSFEMVKEQIKLVGLDQQNIELAHTGIQSMIHSVKDSPKLSSLLKFLFSSKISYAYQHAHLVAVVSYFILNKLNTFKPVHLELITSAAFFCDITLKSQEQIKVNSESELEESELSELEKTEVLQHAKRAAKLLKDYPKYPDELQTIVQQHHGSLDGVGFPAKPSLKMHPLSQVFLVADYFVKEVLNPNAPKDKAKILDQVQQKLPDESYEKMVNILKQKLEV